jgi:exosome complex component RRP45
MTTPSIEPNRPSETEILLSRLLEKTLRRSGALDTESLCLIAGQKCWSVRADVHVLSHDGNLVDVACIGVIAALQHFRKPDTSTEGEGVTVYTLEEREPVPLSILHCPYCITFSFYKQEGEAEGEVISLVDTTLLEEQLRDGAVTVGINRHGEVCQIAKLGGTPVDAVVLLGCVQSALGKVRDISKVVESKLEEDKRRRDKGGRMAELLSSENDRVS